LESKVELTSATSDRNQVKTCPCFTGGVHARLERFISKHAEKIRGTLSCFDRILFRDYLPFFSGAAFAAFLDRRRIRRAELKSFLLRQAQAEYSTDIVFKNQRQSKSWCRGCWSTAHSVSAPGTS